MIFLPPTVFPEESYKFERMWPTLVQPWYFHDPIGIAVDNDGNVYVSDLNNHRIQKFSENGDFLTKWSIFDYNKVQFSPLTGIALDRDKNVYVSITWAQRIFKFSAQGEFITIWGGDGADDGQFQDPGGIAVDGDDNIYVVDVGNNRIQKFNSNGDFISKWGSKGDGDGQFDFPSGIAVDGDGRVYVADGLNYRVQKFNSNGDFIAKWGMKGDGDGQFDYLRGICVDGDGNVYVADVNSRIQKFSSNGGFITKWGSYGQGDEQYINPTGITVDGFGNVYVADMSNHRIQKLDKKGKYVAKWGSRGRDDGTFKEPYGIAVDGVGNVYVGDDRNHCVQKFSSNGHFSTNLVSYDVRESFLYQLGVAADDGGDVFVLEAAANRVNLFNSNGDFILKWATDGNSDGQISFPRGVAVDGDGNVYVADESNYRIQKFNRKGGFIAKWGSRGDGEGQFEHPVGIAVDLGGNVYVIDEWNHRVQKFKSNGDFIATWGNRGRGDGQFQYPGGIAVDGDTNVYVTDTWNHRIQKFRSNGDFVSKFGAFGSDPGLLHEPSGIAVGPYGKLFITDTYNHRVQVFKKVSFASNAKAIIVAGGGPYDGNELWDNTQMCTNFAYRTLTYQGFSKNSIYYITSDTDLDLDNNGVADDVDADATNDNFRGAITEWASDADSLVVYMVDHGGAGSFRMSESEILKASDLDSWLDALQETISGKVTVAYDACHSGSFLSMLTPPEGRERVVIASASPDETAKFVTQGSVSFSSYFWTHVFNGLDIKSAFELSDAAMGYPVEFQHPQLDANGNGVANEPEDLPLVEGEYIGNGTVIHGDVPVIGDVSPDQTISGASSALLVASDVVDSNGIARVWAVIRPPDYHQGASGNPVMELPSIDLTPVGGDRFEARFDEFHITGVYRIAIYARDRVGNTSLPLVTTVTVDNPLSRKAIIVVGDKRSDPEWPAMEHLAELAHEALTFQGYSGDDIYFMSPTTFSIGVDGLSALSNLNHAINTWARADTRDLVIYLLGNGDLETFEINQTETLTVLELDNWLDSLQEELPGGVAVIYDGCRSGSFLHALTPPAGKDRILIASSGPDQPAWVLSNGAISFSQYFWSRVANGGNIRDAFIHAKNAMGLLRNNQSPCMDDNGNGVGNEKEDGQLARNYTLGAGVILAGDDPIIGSVYLVQTQGGAASETIRANGVTTTGVMSRVWAVVTPPNFSPGSPTVPVTELPTFELSQVSDSGYEGICNRFDLPGDYHIAVYTMDDEGNVSTPKTLTVSRDAIVDVAPDIKINGSDETIAVGQGEPVSLGLGMAPGGLAGENADWWIVEFTPEGLWNRFYLSTASFVPGLEATFQGPLTDLSHAALVNMVDLSLGDHVFVFGVDMEMNGIPDVDRMVYDTVTVSVVGE